MSVALEEIHLPGSFLGTCALWCGLLAVTGAIWAGTRQECPRGTVGILLLSPHQVTGNRNKLRGLKLCEAGVKILTGCD